jgi:hypothetical protein
VLRAREVKGGHLKLEVELGSGERVSAFGPNMGERATGLEGSVRLSGKLVRDRFRGGDAAEIRLGRID